LGEGDREKEIVREKEKEREKEKKKRERLLRISHLFAAFLVSPLQFEGDVTRGGVANDVLRQTKIDDVLKGEMNTCVSRWH
jgi:hypothetical protein